MPELSPITTPQAPPWRTFVSQRFPDLASRRNLRRALQRTFVHNHQRPTSVHLIGTDGKSALLDIVVRACRAAGVPTGRVAFTHAYGHESAFDVDGTEPVDPPLVLWAAHQHEPVEAIEGRESIFLRMADAVERTSTLSRDVSTLDVLLWIGDEPS